MKKILVIILTLISVSSIAQTTRSVLGLNPYDGRPGYVYKDTIYSVPNTALFYFNGYGNFVSLRDTARSLFSVAKTPLSYNSTTGQFDFDTTKFHSYAYYQTVFGSGGGSSALSGLTAATATNSINNLAYKQTWNWNSLANDTGFIIRSVNTGGLTASNNQVLFAVTNSGTNTTSNDTTTTVVFSNTHAPFSTTGVNIAARFLASGSLTQNTAASFEGTWAGGNIRIGSKNQAGNIYFVRGDGGQSSLQVATIGWLSATESSIFQIAGSNGGGELRNAGGNITFYTPSNGEIARFSGTKLFLGTTTGSGLLNLKAGSTTQPPVQFTSVSAALTTTPINGTLEYVSDGFYQTNGGGVRYAMGGVIATFNIDSSNTGTAETNLDRYSFPPFYTPSLGESIDAIYGGTFATNTTATLKVYFGGYLLANTGAMTVTAGGMWNIKTNIVISPFGSATKARCTTVITCTGSTVTSYTNYYETTNSSSFPTGMQLNISATSTGATGDIVSKMGKITFSAPAHN